MSLTKQSANSWRFECMVHGRRFSKTYRTYGETKSEIQKKFLLWKIDCGKRMCSNSQYTFKEFAQIWIEDYCKEFSPIVVRNYKRNLDNWILPKLGEYKLNEITPILLDTFVNELKSAKTKYGYRENKQLSNGTISKIFAITRTILNIAYQKDLIDRNPCQKVKLEFRKPIGEEQPHFWDIDTYHKALELLEEEKTENALTVEFAIKTGLRRSEIWGLTWEDVDFEEGSLSVNKTLQKVNGVMEELPCKTLSSVRQIAIPTSLLEKLKAYKGKHKENKHIFENIDYDAATQWFKEWQVRNSIPRIRFHDLRHSHASLLLYKGIDIKTISERLGHSNIGTTMNIYTHVMKELDKKCAVALDSI